jgi:hypothetical protein
MSPPALDYVDPRFPFRTSKQLLSTRRYRYLFPLIGTFEARDLILPAKDLEIQQHAIGGQSLGTLFALVGTAELLE